MKKRYAAEYLAFTKHVNQTCADLMGQANRLRRWDQSRCLGNVGIRTW